MDRVSIFERDEGLIAPGNRFFHRVPLQRCRSEQKEPERREKLDSALPAVFVLLRTQLIVSAPAIRDSLIRKESNCFGKNIK